MQADTQLPTTPPLSGADLVTKLNAIIETLGTNFSGSDDPAAFAWPFATWADTGNMLLKRRNAANTAWVVEGRLLERDLFTRRQTFTTSGTFRTDNITTKVRLSGCGAGGHGGYAASGGAAAGGGSGAWCLNLEVVVTPNTDYSVVIGAAAYPTAGATEFGTILTLSGGSTGAETGSPDTFVPGGAGGAVTGPTGAYRGQVGGYARAPDSPFGAGGSTPFGMGGVNTGLTAETLDRVSPTGFGSGGCGSFSSQLFDARVPGRPGVLIVEW